MATNPVIIITGANGFVGAGLLSYFYNLGWQVRAFARAIPETRIPGVTYVQYNLENKIDGHFLSGADCLIHCAFQFSTTYGLAEINHKATTNLLASCREYSIKFIYISSFSAIQNATSNYGKIKNACEKLCSPEHDLVLKPGLILGQGGLFYKMLNNLRKSPFFPLFGDGTQPLQTIAIHDLCRITEIGIRNDISGSYFIAEERPVHFKVFIQHLAALLNRNIYFIYFPFSLTLALSRLAEYVGLKTPFSTDNILGLRMMEGRDVKDDMARFGVVVCTYQETLESLIRAGT